MPADARGIVVAGALRPVVVLMLLASVLFVAAGVLDGVYPGGDAWDLSNIAAVSYLFAVINTVVAILVARGSERSLALRIGLSLFFVFERPASALLFAKSTPSMAVHFSTALVELIILVSAFRVWRLGHSMESGDMDKLLAIDENAAPVAAPASEREETSLSAEGGAISPRSALLIGITTLLLAAVLVADGLVSGFLPGGREWGLTGDSSEWLVYLFAVVALTIAMRAVHGGKIPLRLLTATALIFFVERAFSPFVLHVLDPVALGLHEVAAFVALAVALSSASALRASRARHESDVASLEAA